MGSDIHSPNGDACQVSMPWLEEPEARKYAYYPHKPMAERPRLIVLRDEPTLGLQGTERLAGYDYPARRRDCETLAPCPHCAAVVSMRVAIQGKEALVTCPGCAERVFFHDLGSTHWAWKKEPQKGSKAGAGLNHCRPCPFVSCRYHLAIDVSKDSRANKDIRDPHHPDKVYGIETIRLNQPMVEVEDMAQTCTLDIAELQEDENSAGEVIGAALGLTRERIRQISDEVLEKLHAVAEREKFDEPDEATRVPKAGSSYSSFGM